MRHTALAAIALLVAMSAAASFSESYRGLLTWAGNHGLHGFWAGAFPLQVDVFIAVGELALFVALADRWPLRSRTGAWAVTLLGMAVSVAGNVGHVIGDDVASHLTAAVPPLAAAAALAVGLGVLKRVVAAQPDTQSHAALQPVMAIAQPVTAATAAAITAAPPRAARHTAPRKRSATSRRGGSIEMRKARHAEAEALAVAILDAEPQIRTGDLAARLDVSTSTARRLRKDISDARAQSEG
jgi:hypothetical protein